MWATRFSIEGAALKRLLSVVTLLCVAALGTACSTERSNSVVPTARGVDDKGSSNARKPSFVNVNTNPPDNGGGCVDAWTCGSGTTPGGGGGGGGGSTGDGTQVATQGKALQGKACQQPGGNSAAIGTAIQGPDTHSNEVNNVFYVNIGTSNSKGSGAADGGFFETTFGGTTWFQPPANIPGTTSPIYVSMGTNFSISPSSPMSATSFLNLLTNALNAPVNTGSGGVTPGNKNAISSWLNSITGSNPSAWVDPCFDGPWDGTSQA